MEKLMFKLPDFIFESEKAFTAWLGRQIHDAGGLWHKISDMGIDAKPADAIFALDWLAGIIEIKVWNEKLRVDIHPKLRDCQVFWLKRYQKNWWLSLVVYYNKYHHKYRVMEYTPELNLVFSASK